MKLKTDRQFKTILIISFLLLLTLSLFFNFVSTVNSFVYQPREVCCCEKSTNKCFREIPGLCRTPTGESYIDSTGKGCEGGAACSPEGATQNCPDGKTTQTCTNGKWSDCATPPRSPGSSCSEGSTQTCSDGKTVQTCTNGVWSPDCPTRTCGDTGQNCCVSGEYSSTGCKPGLTCKQDNPSQPGICKSDSTACGLEGNSCCPGYQCIQGLECPAGSGLPQDLKCVKCGGVNEKCCTRSSPQCQQDTRCENGICVCTTDACRQMTSCGAENQKCCTTGEQCQQGLSCVPTSGILKVNVCQKLETSCKISPGQQCPSACKDYNTQFGAGGGCTCGDPYCNFIISPGNYCCPRGPSAQTLAACNSPNPCDSANRACDIDTYSGRITGGKPCKCGSATCSNEQFCCGYSQSQGQVGSNGFCSNKECSPFGFCSSNTVERDCQAFFNRGECGQKAECQGAGASGGGGSCVTIKDDAYCKSRYGRDSKCGDDYQCTNRFPQQGSIVCCITGDPTVSIPSCTSSCTGLVVSGPYGTNDQCSQSCLNTRCTVATQDTDCAGFGTPDKCTYGTCSTNGICRSFFAPAGNPCTTYNNLNGKCDGHGNCVVATQGSLVCCAKANGISCTTDCSNGVIVKGPYSSTEQCTQSCFNTQCTVATEDTDCASFGTPDKCTYGQCSTGGGTTGTCHSGFSALGNPCITSNGLNGHCDGLGKCVVGNVQSLCYVSASQPTLSGNQYMVDVSVYSPNLPSGTTVSIDCGLGLGSTGSGTSVRCAYLIKDQTTTYTITASANSQACGSTSVTIPGSGQTSVSPGCQYSSYERCSRYCSLPNHCTGSGVDPNGCWNCVKDSCQPDGYSDSAVCTQNCKYPCYSNKGCWFCQSSATRNCDDTFCQSSGYQGGGCQLGLCLSGTETPGGSCSFGWKCCCSGSSQSKNETSVTQTCDDKFCQSLNKGYTQGGCRFLTCWPDKEENGPSCGWGSKCCCSSSSETGTETETVTETGSVTNPTTATQTGQGSMSCTKLTENRWRCSSSDSNVICEQDQSKTDTWDCHVE